MDLNCITGRRWGPEGASKPGEGGTEMEFWFNRRENNPSLTVWRLSLPLSPSFYGFHSFSSCLFFLTGGISITVPTCKWYQIRMVRRKRHIWSNYLPTDMFMLFWSGKSITKLCDKRKSKCTCWIINERLDMTCSMNGLISLWVTIEKSLFTLKSCLHPSITTPPGNVNPAVNPLHNIHFHVIFKSIHSSQWPLFQKIFWVGVETF